jgi:hypothetical protein
MFLSVNGTAQSYGTAQDVLSPLHNFVATGRAAPSTQF